MYELLISKFSDPGLRDKLIATGDAELIEGNNHWDRYCGVCRSEGQNKLGKLLMKVREEVKRTTKDNNIEKEKVSDVEKLFYRPERKKAR